MQIEDALGQAKGGMRLEDFVGGRKLSFGGMPQNTADSESYTKTALKGQGEAASFFAGDYAHAAQNANYSKSSIEEETIAEKLARKESTYKDAETEKRNLSMAVAGFSVEDLSGAQEAGYDVEEMEANGIVTVIDQIKLHLAMGGKDISAMGGLSDSDIKALSNGSTGYEAAITDALNAADLPVSEDIQKDGAIALKKTEELREAFPEGMGEASIEFLLKNELEPTIENVYQGSFSRQGSTSSAVQISESDFKELAPQIEKLFEKSDIVPDNEHMAQAEWMLKKGIAITPESLSYMDRLKNVKADFSEEAVLNSVTESVSEGKRPQEAYLLPGYSVASRAKEAADTIQNVSDEQAAKVADRGEELNIKNLRHQMIMEEKGIEPAEVEIISEDNVELHVEEAPELNDISDEKQVRAMRVLEEARLLMTVKANASLIRQGISLDTTELSDVVEHLRELEKGFYRTVLTKKEEPVSEDELDRRIELFESTNSSIEELSGMPASLLSRVKEVSRETVISLNRQGRSLIKAYSDAGERYETMRTEIRRDLGDSRAKAFKNVDTLLEGLELETTEANRRAVRILGYNEQEITVESVSKIKENDRLVSQVFKNLTPGVVAKMIKEGENPLNLTIEELNEKTEEIRQVSPSASDEGQLGKFLFKAQRSGELSDEERNALIGVYRLIYQVEKTDGAVIGQLMAQGADITLKNMMTAAKSRRHQNREYKIDDDFGFAEFDKKALTITEQIEMAFQTKRMKDAGELLSPQKLLAFDDEDSYLSLSPDAFAEALESGREDTSWERQEKEFEKVHQARIKEAVAAEERVYDFLSRFDLPESPANLEAFSRMLSDRNDMYRRLFKRSERTVFGTEDDGVAEGEVSLSDVMDDLLKEFGEAVKGPKEMAEAQQHLEEIAENVMKNMLVEQPVGTIDVRGMQITIKQIKSMGELSRHTETYSMPILVEDSVGNLSLRILRAPEEEKGQVRLSFESEKTGTVDASFRYDTDGVHGVITTSLSLTRERINAHIEDIAAQIEEAAGQRTEISLKTDVMADANNIFTDYDAGFEPRTDDIRPPVQTRALYGIARSFIDALGKL